MLMFIKRRVSDGGVSDNGSTDKRFAFSSPPRLATAANRELFHRLPLTVRVNRDTLTGSNPRTRSHLVVSAGLSHRQLEVSCLGHSLTCDVHVCSVKLQRDVKLAEMP